MWGTLEVGKRADIAIWDIGHPHELSYWMGLNELAELLIAGQAAGYPSARSNDNFKTDR